MWVFQGTQPNRILSPECMTCTGARNSNAVHLILREHYFFNHCTDTCRGASGVTSQSTEGISITAHSTWHGHGGSLHLLCATQSMAPHRLKQITRLCPAPPLVELIPCHVSLVHGALRNLPMGPKFRRAELCCPYTPNPKLYFFRIACHARGL